MYICIWMRNVQCMCAERGYWNWWFEERSMIWETVFSMTRCSDKKDAGIAAWWPLKWCNQAWNTRNTLCDEAALMSGSKSVLLSNECWHLAIVFLKGSPRMRSGCFFTPGAYVEKHAQDNLKHHSTACHAKISPQRHTLPKRDYTHSISEVIIILNNDQHQHQKTISTNNRIN